MILTTLKLFQELMAFLDEREEHMSPANLKKWLDERAIALTPPSPEALFAQSKEVQKILYEEYDKLVDDIANEMKPYADYQLKTIIDDVSGKVKEFLNL